MARYVKVSALGLKPIEFSNETSYDDMVICEWKHLNSWIEKVLYDEPDFIVLNECCDRPTGLTRTQQKEYYDVRGTEILKKNAQKNNVNIAYSAGSHEGFACSGGIDNYTLVFDLPETLENYAGLHDENGSIRKKLMPYLNNEREIKLDYGLFSTMN